jgi:hypothetical protein
MLLSNKAQWQIWLHFCRGVARMFSYFTVTFPKHTGHAFCTIDCYSNNLKVNATAHTMQNNILFVNRWLCFHLLPWYRLWCHTRISQQYCSRPILSHNVLVAVEVTVVVLKGSECIACKALTAAWSVHWSQILLTPGIFIAQWLVCWGGGGVFEWAGASQPACSSAFLHD